jgi:nucleoside-diphosphate-sugar epimerase
MRVFVTGATGFVGSAIVADLISAGHKVLGLTRSESRAKSLAALGAEAHRGDLLDLESLRIGAGMSDAVIHAAFDHDFSKFAENCEADRLAIEVLGDVLQGSARPLIVTSGLPLLPNRIVAEDDEPAASSQGSPRVSEQTALAMVARGVRVSVVRVSQVHDQDRQGLAAYMIALARDKGISAYVGDGLNRWPAVHRLDVAPIYRLAVEKGSVGAKYHAVAEEGVAVRRIAEAIGQGLKIPVVALSPEEAARHFGWLAFPVSMDAPASSARTQERLGWHPTDGPLFLADLQRSRAFDTRRSQAL